MRRILASTAIALLTVGPLAAYAAEGEHGFIQSAEESDFYGSNLIGMDIYATDTDIAPNATVATDDREGWENIGEVNDLLLSGEGEIKAVLVDIGGFLELGEHTVALDMNQLNLLTDENGVRFAAVNATRESLEAAPEFERTDQMAVDEPAAPAGTAAPTGGMAAAPETPAEPAEGMAAAPEPATPPATDPDTSAASTEMAVDPVVPTDDMAADQAAPAEGMAAGEMAPAEDRAAGEAAPAEEMAATEPGTPVAPTIELEGYAPLPPEELTAEMLEGATVYGPDDQAIGEISELVLDSSGKITDAVVDVGGFLGMGEHSVAIGFEEMQMLHSAEDNEVRVYINASEENLEQRPEFEG